MGRLQGKRCLVTGGTSGIGLASARAFVREGARVAITGHNPETLAAAREALGPEVLVIAADAGSVAAQDGLATALRSSFGALDAVFVNAGIGEFRPLQAWDEAGFDRLLDVNLKGPFFLLRALQPLLASPCAIVLNGSIAAHVGLPNGSVYAASKAALVSLARTLSAELHPRGIRINTISPGPVTTPIYAKLGLPPSDHDAMTDSMRRQIPLQRFGRPEEIADAAVFLASDESSFMLGAELMIDGGYATL